MRLSPDDVVRAATRHYLSGAPIDMSSLAAELGLARATLYRRVGNREQLFGQVLAVQTARTFAAARAGVSGAGLPLVLAVLERFMQTVLAAEPLRALAERDPLLFINTVMAPGPVETCAAGLVAGLLDEQVAAGAVTLRLPSAVVAQALVRVADSSMYAHLLGGRPPEIDMTVVVITLMLESMISST